MLNNEMSDRAIINELGLRISRYRLNKNITQSSLAYEAGVSTATICRIESGASIQLLKLIRILRALNLIKNIESLIPEIPISPLLQLKMKGKIKQRASSSKKDDKKADWSWGDNK